MTSKKSSLNPALFTYRKALKSKLPLIIALCVLVIAELGDVFSYIKEYLSIAKSGDTTAAEKLRNTMAFVFCEQEGDMGIVDFMFEVLLIAAAAFLAFSLFSFLLKKNSVNVMYSLGISRSRFFAAKLLAGVTVIVLGIGIPMIIITIANAAFFGMSVMLIKASLYLFIRLASAMLWTLAVFTLTTVMTGSLFEAVIEGGVVFVSPYLISSVIGNLMSITAYGSPYSSGFTSFKNTFTDIGGYTIDTEFKLFDFADYILPISYDDDTGVLAFEEGAGVPQIYFGGAIIFLAVIICIFAASVILNSRRNAEKAGFMGTSPLLQGYCVVTVGPWLAGLVSGVFGSENINAGEICAVYFISAFVIMTVGYTVVDFICIRSFKKYAKRLKYLGIELGIFAVISVAFAIGTNLAYSSVPEKQEIKSVSVSVPAAYVDISDGYTSGSYVQDGVLRADSCTMINTCNMQMVGEFTDEKIIEEITSVNEKLKNIRKSSTEDYTDFSYYGNRTFPYKIRIEYTLENGRKTSRMYSIADDETLCSIYEAVLGTKQAEEIAVTHMTADYGGIMIYLMSPNGSDSSEPKVLNRDNESTSREELYEGLRNDILAGTLPLDFKSDAEIIGYISTADTTIPVYADMENTISVLEKYDLMSCFESKSEPVKISVFSYSDACRYQADISSGILTCIVTGDETDEDDYEVCYDEEGNVIDEKNAALPDNTVVITDPTKIAEAEKSVRLCSTMVYGGKFVKMEYENGRTVFAYMPAYLK